MYDANKAHWWVLLAAGVLAYRVGFAQEIAATYGTRVPPLPAGEGGNLSLSAPPEFCVDDRCELRVRRFENVAEQLDVLRGPAGPSACIWMIDRLKPAIYDAMILDRRKTSIVATAVRQELPRGAEVVMRLERTSSDIEGRITINGIPPPSGELLFSNRDLSWTVPLASDGRFSVTIEQAAEDRTCVRLKRDANHKIGNLLLGCESFTPGAHWYDRDLQIVPAVIRVIVPAWPKPERVGPRGLANDETAVGVNVTGKGTGAGSVSFKATEGFRGEYIGSYGDYEVGVKTTTGKQFPRVRVTLSAVEPTRTVTLTLPVGSLGCDDGWWYAC